MKKKKKKKKKWKKSDLSTCRHDLETCHHNLGHPNCFSIFKSIESHRSLSQKSKQVDS